eukprot:gene5285-6126_t
MMEIDVLGSESDINSSLIDSIPTTVQELLQQSEIRRQLKNQPVYLKYFWKILLIISVFYFLPSIQFVFFQYKDPQAQCYFNFKCAKSFMGLRAFNNGSGLLFFTLHQKRHATFTAGAFRAFSFFAMFIFLDFLSLTDINGYVFWTVFTLVFAYVSISGSGYLLAHRRLSLNPSVTILWSYMKKLRHPTDIEDKGFGFYFFEIAVTNKFLTFDESMKLNKPCVLFDFFDTHDVWHFFSSVGLFTVMAIAYLIDWDLRTIPRSLIHVF